MKAQNSFLVFVCFLLSVSLQAQNKWYIKPTGSATATGNSWANAASGAAGLQNRLDAAAPGDTIFVAAGTYIAPNTDGFYMRNGVQVVGGFPATLTGTTPSYAHQADKDTYETILEAVSEHKNFGHGRALYQAENFTHPTEWNSVYITMGNAMGKNSTAELGLGGGAYIKRNGILRNCVIEKNAPEFGNTNPMKFPVNTQGLGVYIASGGLVDNCIIRDQVVTQDLAEKTTIQGVGAYIAEGGVLQNSEIYGNQSTSAMRIEGGGIYNRRGTVRNCKIHDNQIGGPTAAATTGSHGAGIKIDEGYIENCEIYNNGRYGTNTAVRLFGGGVYCMGSDARVTANINNCRIYNNNASTGAGVFLIDYSLLQYSTISGNKTYTAAGTDQHPNTGGGVLADYRSSVMGSYISGNTAGGGAAILLSRGSRAVSCVIDENSTTGSDERGGIVQLMLPTTGVTTNTLLNCTMVKNTATSGNGRLFYDQPSPAASNAIVNTVALGNIFASHYIYSNTSAGGSALVPANCILETDANNPDPLQLFRDWSAKDYSIRQFSTLNPMIDGGDDALYEASLIHGGAVRFDVYDYDIVGSPRVYNLNFGGIIDIGAFEYDALSILYVDESKPFDPQKTGLSWAEAFGGKQGLSYAIAKAAHYRYDVNEYTLITQIRVAEGTYYPLDTLLMKEIYEDWNEVEGTRVREVGDVETAPVSPNGFTVLPGVVVVGGLDNTSTTNDLPDTISNRTVLDARRKGRVITQYRDFEGSDYALWTGFKLSNGSAFHADFARARGGGAYMRGGSALTYSTVEECVANYGGGIFKNSRADTRDDEIPVTFSDLIITRDTARYAGGGVYNGTLGAETFLNCRIIFNHCCDGRQSLFPRAGSSLTPTNTSWGLYTDEFMATGNTSNLLEKDLDANGNFYSTTGYDPANAELMGRGGGGLFNIRGADGYYINCLFAKNSAHTGVGAIQDAVLVDDTNENARKIIANDGSNFVNCTIIDNFIEAIVDDPLYNPINSVGGVNSGGTFTNCVVGANVRKMYLGNYGGHKAKADYLRTSNFNPERMQLINNKATYSLLSGIGFIDGNWNYGTQGEGMLDGCSGASAVVKDLFFMPTFESYDAESAAELYPDDPLTDGNDPLPNDFLYNPEIATADNFNTYDIHRSYTPKGGSPLIDAGTNNVNLPANVNVDEIDLGGNPRVLNETIDIGAFEYANFWTGAAGDSIWYNPLNWMGNTVLEPGGDLYIHTLASTNAMINIRDITTGGQYAGLGYAISDEGFAQVHVRHISNPSPKHIDLANAELIYTGNELLGDANIHSNGEPDCRSIVSFQGENQRIKSRTFVNNTIDILDISKLPSDLTLAGNITILDSIRFDEKAAGRINTQLVTPNIITLNSIDNDVQKISGKPFRNNRMFSFSLVNSPTVLSDSLVITNWIDIAADASNLTLTPGAFLRVHGQVQNNRGPEGLTLKADPAKKTPSPTLIFGGTRDVYATVELYSKSSVGPEGTPAVDRFAFQYMGIPLKILEDVSPTFNGTWLRVMNENGTLENLWTDLRAGDSAEAFKGYSLAATTDTVPILFTGALTKDDMAFDNLAVTQGALYSGFHLLANSYTAAIDIRAMRIIPGNGTIYLYNTGTYSDWWNANSGGTTQPSGSESTTPGQYVASTKETAGIAGVPRYIPSMQGFMVKASITYDTDGIISSRNDLLDVHYSEVAARNYTTMRSPEKQPEEKPTVTCVKLASEHFTDNVWLFTNAECTDGIDRHWDAEKMFSQYADVMPALYADETAGKMQIDAKSDINRTYLGFKASERDTEYTLSFTHENPEAFYSRLYLVDLERNVSVDITKNESSYSFTADNTQDITKRFLILTEPFEETVSEKRISISNSSSIIFVHNYVDADGTVAVYDASGRMLHTKKLQANGTTILSTGLSTGVYIVNAMVGNEKYTEKIVISD